MNVYLEGGPEPAPRGIRIGDVRVTGRLAETPDCDVPTMNVADRHTGKAGSWAPDEPRRYDAEGRLILSWQGWK